ncbi:hypothetical protein [Aminobacter ciceronei]|uniref:Methyl-accepting chemotaxis protein n=1 Tax=Aminobacter ciceronei TaxID=150723 RepID=A0ABR6CGX5_9HYPH|nr:hypothetical protein [Aminobacter ciceronei]MBA9023961.1 hypothetical protein [Aminobacter ciceronei]
MQNAVNSGAMVSSTAATETLALPDARAQKSAVLELNLSRLRRATWVLSAFSSILLLLTAVSMIVAFQMWGMLSETRELAEKLGNLGGFEKRVVDRLDSFNVGVQSLIDRTNGRLEEIRVEAEKAAKLSQESAQRIGMATDQLEMRMNSFALQSDDGEAIDFGPAEQPVTRSAPGRNAAVAAELLAGQPEATQGNPAPLASQSFRRTTNADGSVTYEKVR